MTDSLSPSTVKQYNTTYKLWWNYCTCNNYSYLEAQVPRVILFLTEQFQKGASYGSLNSHRSALSLLLGNRIGSDEQVSRLLKGVFKNRPSVPKYNYTWNPQTVLDFIGNWYPNNNLPLDKLTKKLATLVALCTAHRVQTLSVIKVEDIVISQNQIIIRISDIIKTSAAGREQPTLLLPYFNDKPNICPAKCLEDYLSVTKNIRESNELKYLFITHKRPHKRATAQTISRWIKEALAASGIDVTTFGAHSTRHAATSSARAAGLSVDSIRKTAGWTQNSQAFARFYNRPIIVDNFARSLFESRL